ncbi:MAG: hypothetical protein WB791_04025, partial [Waddliaceae bacterium]
MNLSANSYSPSFFIGRIFFCFLLVITTSSGNAEENIPHECGVALVRLRHPLSYYAKKFDNPAWGVVKLLSLMEKQRHRGQDGAGVSVFNSHALFGETPLHCFHFASKNALNDLIVAVMADLQQLSSVSGQSSPFIGEIYLGHLRYATYGGLQLKYCQPFVRAHPNPCLHFSLAGNFNMTNMSALCRQLKEWGAAANTGESDTQVILNMLAHQLDREYDPISNQIDLVKVVKQAAAKWDGGYVFGCMLGNGDVFLCRDPAGIRPGYYIVNEDVIAAASEKGALMEAFDLEEEEVLPIQPGNIIVIKSNGEIKKSPFTESLRQRQCTFERIYFSKIDDPQIYRERRRLGQNLALKVLESLEDDLSQTVFTYVPHSGLIVFQGLVDEVIRRSHQNQLQEIKDKMERGIPLRADVSDLPQVQPRVDYIIEKLQKIRTFISPDKGREDLVDKTYHVRKGIVREGDTVVIVEDSIVRGTTLRESIIKKVIALKPKKIIVVSASPPILYPDCYGIDMSQMGHFIAFQAAVSLLKEQGKTDLLEEVRIRCLKQSEQPCSQMCNEVKRIYDCLTLEDISSKVARLLTPDHSNWEGSIEVIYQSLDGLRNAMPDYEGDWYFSGEYPTAGGFAVLNKSYLQWCNDDDSRSY